MQNSKVLVCIHKRLVGKLDIILVEFKTILIRRIFSSCFLSPFLLNSCIFVFHKTNEALSSTTNKWNLTQNNTFQSNYRSCLWLLLLASKIFCMHLGLSVHFVHQTCPQII